MLKFLNRADYRFFLHTFSAVCVMWFFVRVDYWQYIRINYLDIFIGIVAGIILYKVEKLFLRGFGGRRSKKAMVKQFWGFLKANFILILIHLTTAILEELFYRVFLQSYLLKANLVGVVVTAILFTLVHKNSLENRALIFDFIFFAFFMGALYFVTSSIFLLVVIHFTRNVAILFDIYLKQRREK